MDEGTVVIAIGIVALLVVVFVGWFLSEIFSPVKNPVPRIPKPKWKEGELPHESEKGVHGSGWKVDKFTDSKSLIAWGMGVQEESGEGVGLKLQYDVQGVMREKWAISILGISMRKSKIEHLYLLTDGESHKIMMSGQGAGEGAWMMLSDKNVLKAICTANVIEFRLDGVEGRVSEEGTEGFRRMGGYLYPG